MYAVTSVGGLYIQVGSEVLGYSLRSSRFVVGSCFTLAAIKTKGVFPLIDRCTLEFTLVPVGIKYRCRGRRATVPKPYLEVSKLKRLHHTKIVVPKMGTVKW